MQHPATWETAKLLAECRFRRQRRSGPGGQHRNKVETAVFITHEPTSIHAEASERRSQEQNRQQAIFRLRVNLALHQRCPLDPDTDQPSELWRNRCRGGRISVNRSHTDFPAILAEALDVLHSQRHDMPSTATWLGCTASQLLRLLKLEPRALAQVNQTRREVGMRPLR